MSDHHHADCPEGAACREIEAAVLQRDEELRAWDRLKADRDRLAAENIRLADENTRLREAEMATAQWLFGLAASLDMRPSPEHVAALSKETAAFAHEIAGASPQ